MQKNVKISVDFKLLQDCEDSQIAKFHEVRYSEDVHGRFGGMKRDLENHMDWVKNLSQRNDIECYAIFMDSSVVGGASIKNINYCNRNAEFDLFLSHEARGNRIGKASMSFLQIRAFQHLKLKRLYAYLIEVNTRALSLYLNVGFHVEGRLRKNVWKGGSYCDSILISKLIEEYECSD